MLDDFIFDGISDYESKISFEVQVYVRDGVHFGGKKKGVRHDNLLILVFTLKVLIKELSNLPSNFIEEWKQKNADYHKGGARFLQTENIRSFLLRALSKP